MAGLWKSNTSNNNKRFSETLISIAFIINPISGGRNKRRVEKAIDRFFNKNEFLCKKIYSTFPSHAFELARNEMNLGTDIIVAVGGDGTINEIARALMFSETRLGIIPMGSGNGFARHFGIPLSISGAVKRIISGKDIKIDIGFVNGKPFFCTSGIGFDAETGMIYSQFDTRGFISYAFSFFRVFKKYHAKQYEISTDHEKIETEAFFINIANISQLGYHFYIAPGASASDGSLDLVIIREFPKWKGIFLAGYSFFAKIDKSNYVIRRKVKNVKIRTGGDKTIIHIDGEPEPVKEKEFVYSIKHESLRVII